MTKRKKVTRAYKVGHTDGRNGEHKNHYAERSTWWTDYERGFDAGSKTTLDRVECEGVGDNNGFFELGVKA